MAENDIKKIFAHNIQKLRRSKNLTQKGLAGQLGLGKTTISQWESAQKLPNAGSIEKTAIFFNVPKSLLFKENNSCFTSLNRQINLPIVKGMAYIENKVLFEDIEGYEPTPED